MFGAARTRPAAPARTRASGPSRPDLRRVLQLGLACLWVVDGLLQYQPFMFTRSFATQMLAPTAHGNPDGIAATILWAARAVAGNPAWANAGFATVQLAIGLAIAFRPTLRTGLAASTVWAVLVWWFGEGLGGILTPGPGVFGGAPGAAILYGLAALLLWPPRVPRAQRPAPFVAAAPFGALPARIVWAVLWAGLAALTVGPGALAPGSVYDTVAGAADGQPGWAAAPARAAARLVAGHGAAVNITTAVLLVLVAAGVFLPPAGARAAVAAAVLISAAVWAGAEVFGAVFGGMATDVNTGPLLALLAAAYWPTRPRAGTPA